MAQGNRFFAFDQPIRWFKAVGSSLSPSSSGRTRILDTVHEQSVAEPGDVAHALAGGTFLVRRDGTVESGRLRLPAGRSTAGAEPDSVILERLSNRGVCRETGQPPGRIAYKAALKGCTARRFPDHTGAVTMDGYVESPLMRTLSEAVDATGVGEVIRTAGGTLSLHDVGLGRDRGSLDGSLRIEVPDGVNLDIRISPLHGMLMVYESGDGGFVEALQSVDDDALGLTPEHRTATITAIPVDETEILMRVIAHHQEAGHLLGSARQRM